MKVSQKGLDLIKKYEGFYSDAYLCPANVWTYGFGSIVKSNGQSVIKGDTITQSEALKLLELQVNEHSSTIPTYVKVELNQNQFDALASFQYNLGKNILKGSKLLEYLNAKNWTKAMETLRLYNKASGKVLSGLNKRRNEESELFLTPIKEGGNSMVNFICPIDNPKITSKYGMRKHPVTGKNQLHAGIDLVSTKVKNPPVHASASGTVRLIKDMGTSGYGKYVIITHTVGGVKYETVYAHLKSYSVKVGQKVTQGEAIGILGNTGIGTGDHLHWEVHKGTYNYGNGTYPTSFDPMKVMELKNTPSTIKKTTSTSKENVIVLTEADRKSARSIIKLACQQGVFDGKVHTDAKINSYTDSQLASYMIIYITRKINK